MTQTTSKKEKQVIGRAELLSFPELGISGVHARIDSGARTSAIWVSYAAIEDNKLAVIFFGPGAPRFTGEKHFFNSYDQDIVTSSNGHKQLRFKIKLRIKLQKRIIRASFTLADRSTQVYPILVGRNVLRGKFVVDVQTGTALVDKERELLRQKRAELGEREDA